MKLSDLRPCPICHGPLLKTPCATWRVIRVTQALINPQRAREVMGLNTMLGSLAIAEVMAPAADEAVKILGDESPSLTTEIHVCFDCYCERFGMLLEAVEAADALIGGGR